MTTVKETTRLRRKNRIRSQILGKTDRPRLLVFRSLTHIYAQLIDDKTKKVIVAASDMKSNDKGTKVEKAKKVGEEIAKKATEQKISEIVFDRNGYKYHGRVKALAEGARDGGLKF